MQIGSFLELQFARGKEFFQSNSNIARLNSGRCAIYHAIHVLGCHTVWIPYYQCDTVRNFLTRKNIRIRYYHIDSDFTPRDIQQSADEAVLLVNYYGVMSQSRMKSLTEAYCNCIIDNSQAFFCPPIADCLNVYSCRKFVGVPDGAYVIGRGAEKFEDEYPQGFSSDTSLFLLQRIEHGCEGRSYQSRLVNEHRIDTEDIMRMSKLTFTILDGTDYEFIKSKRRENFDTACDLFGEINQINPRRNYDGSCVPMVYPLVIEDDTLLERLQNAKHFQGHWWSYLCDELPENTFESWLSRYVIPMTIDQRYGKSELADLHKVVIA